MDIPEHYRQFQTPKTKKPEEEKKTETQPQEQVAQKTQPKAEKKLIRRSIKSNNMDIEIRNSIIEEVFI